MVRLLAHEAEFHHRILGGILDRLGGGALAGRDMNGIPDELLDVGICGIAR
jgi:hypothetical protein